MSVNLSYSTAMLITAVKVRVELRHAALPCCQTKDLNRAIITETRADALTKDLTKTFAGSQSIQVLALPDGTSRFTGGVDFARARAQEAARRPGSYSTTPFRRCVTCQTARPCLATAPRSAVHQSVSRVARRGSADGLRQSGGHACEHKATNGLLVNVVDEVSSIVMPFAR